VADAERGRSRPLRGLVLVGGLCAAALLAPLIANDRPILAWQEGRITFPFAGGAWEPLAGGHAVWPPVPYSYRDVRLQEALQPPSSRHLLGTDTLGRDLLARIVYGARVSLLVGFGATLLALSLGAILGGAAGLQGGGTDLVLTRVIEVLGCFPSFILALALVTAAGGSGLAPLVTAIGLSRAAAAARFIRGEVHRWRGAGHFIAARAAGATLPRLATRHLFPLVAGPLAVQAVFGVAHAILLESSLSFLGLGVQPPTPSWGMILAEGRGTMEVAWWLVVFPAAALALTLATLSQAPHGGAEIVGRR
jgi:peptide/nickel transport system permease protein